MNLADRALLVQLSISTWTARKHDRRVTKSAVDSFGAMGGSGRFNKDLLPGSRELDEVLAFSRGIRVYFYENTLAWDLEGQRILPAKNFLNFVGEMRNRKDTFLRLTNSFIDNYEAHVQQSRQWLGDMYDPSDYPSVDAIRKKFKIDLATFPVPADDFRVGGIDHDELEQVRGDIHRRVQEAQVTAMRDAWSRLHDKVQKLHDKLADPSAIFRDSLIENLQETCDMLGKLNVMDDPDLDNMRRDVRATLAGYNPESLRLDLDLRSNVADRAKAALNKMAAFYAPEE